MIAGPGRRGVEISGGVQVSSRALKVTLLFKYLVVVFKFLTNQENSTLYFKFSLDDSVLDNIDVVVVRPPQQIFPRRIFLHRFLQRQCGQSDILSSIKSKLTTTDSPHSRPRSRFKVVYFTNFPDIRLILLNLIEINRLMCSLQYLKILK